MCTELLPPGGYPIAVKYIISYIRPPIHARAGATKTQFPSVDLVLSTTVTDGLTVALHEFFPAHFHSLRNTIAWAA